MAKDHECQAEIGRSGCSAARSPTSSRGAPDKEGIALHPILQLILQAFAVATTSIILLLLFNRLFASPNWGKAQVTGREAATRLLDRLGLQTVKVREVSDSGSPNYHAQSREIRLPSPYYRDRSFLAVFSAAHEVGHAVQIQRFPILRQWAQNQFSLFWAVTITSGGALVTGVLRENPSLVGQGVPLYYLMLLVSVMMWVWEIDASRRGIRLLLETDLITPAERQKGWALTGVAFGTYVALALGPIVFLSLVILRY